jgi:hypothetical protein
MAPQRDEQVVEETTKTPRLQVAETHLLGGYALAHDRFFHPTNGPQAEFHTNITRRWAWSDMLLPNA